MNVHPIKLDVVMLDAVFSISSARKHRFYHWTTKALAIPLDSEASLRQR